MHSTGTCRSYEVQIAETGSEEHTSAFLGLVSCLEGRNTHGASLAVIYIWGVLLLLCCLRAGKLLCLCNVLVTWGLPLHATRSSNVGHCPAVAKVFACHVCMLTLTVYCVDYDRCTGLLCVSLLLGLPALTNETASLWTTVYLALLDVLGIAWAKDLLCVAKNICLSSACSTDADLGSRQTAYPLAIACMHRSRRFVSGTHR